MSNPADFRVVTCNAKKELRGAAITSTINTAAAHADVLLLQEVETRGHRKAVNALKDKGFAIYWPGGAANATPIAYRTTRFYALSKSKRRLNKGRLFKYPSHYGVKVVLQDRLTTIATGFLNAHMIQQTRTKHKNWRPVWNAGAAILEDYAHDINAKRGGLVGGMDANAPRFAPEGTHGIWPEHGTFGSAHYDTLFYAGGVEVVDGPTRIKTKSDHYSVGATFRRTKK